MATHDEIVHHSQYMKQNKDKTITTEVRVIIHLEDGTCLNAVRKIRFQKDEIEAGVAEEAA